MVFAAKRGILTRMDDAERERQAEVAALSDEEWLRQALLPREPRNEADRALIAFGYDPWQVEWFAALTPLQRLRTLSSGTRWIGLANHQRTS